MGATRPVSGNFGGERLLPRSFEKYGAMATVYYALFTEYNTTGRETWVAAFGRGQTPPCRCCASRQVGTHAKAGCRMHPRVCGIHFAYGH